MHARAADSAVGRQIRSPADLSGPGRPTGQPRQQENSDGNGPGTGGAPDSARFLRTPIPTPRPDRGTESGDSETGLPTARYRRVVNRKRQLELVEDELPSPGPGEVRLRMLAAGVSLPDVMMREGVHPEARRPPFTPGWDVVGTVDALG